MCAVLGPCFVIQYLISIGLSLKDERAGCFTLVLFLLSCGCQCLVSRPRGAMGWSVVWSVIVAFPGLTH